MKKVAAKARDTFGPISVEVEFHARISKTGEASRSGYSSIAVEIVGGRYNSREGSGDSIGEAVLDLAQSTSFRENDIANTTDRIDRLRIELAEAKERLARLKGGAS
ncbi:hypothetical protein Ga0100230_024275 [Opitutaceae bacterium TAV3]|nr:hypothetical protein Ga0100230_024275 [Opitutaceae bacterium TAV3]